MSALSFDLDEVVLRRPVDEDDADALALCTDPEVVRWNPVPDVVDLATALAWCRRGADWSDGTHATWHAVTRGRLVATCALYAIDHGDATARIGYRVAPWARRRGVATAVVDAVTRWGFAELGLARVQLEHTVANVGSCRVATATGFVLEGVLRSAYVDPEGRRHDDHVHGRLVTDPAPERPLRPVLLATAT